MKPTTTTIGKNTYVGLGAVGLVLVALALAFGVSTPNSINNIVSSDLIANPESINPAASTVDWVVGTSIGTIVGGELAYKIYANSSLKVTNATVWLKNSTTYLYNSSVNETNFAVTYRIVSPQTWGTLYLNFTATNGTSTYSSSTNTLTMNPAFGAAAKVDYGSFVTVSGGLLNDTMATIQLYYPSLYIKGVTYNATNEKYSVILSKRA
jgi:hypothetical protein